MKAGDLRFGNWVNSTLPMQVSALKGHWLSPIITCEYDGEEWEFNDDSGLSPIPITEEWLKKFGFDKEGEFFKKARFTIYQPVSYVNYLFCEGESILREVKYIHTLQNLYHALTGQELTIKDNATK